MSRKVTRRVTLRASELGYPIHELGLYFSTKRAYTTFEGMTDEERKMVRPEDNGRTTVRTV